MFTDRREAGTLLVKKITSKDEGTIVVGLARGGVVVASSFALELSLPLDVLVVKKIPAPDQQELGLGAVTPNGIIQVNWCLAHTRGVDEAYIKSVIGNQESVIRQKTLIYRKGKKPLVVRDKTVILVDDGAATGATMEAAIKWCKAKKAKKIVAAIPVVSHEAADHIRPEVDELITLEEPEDFDAVGQFYREFVQVSDEEVIELLNK